MRHIPLFLPIMLLSAGTVFAQPDATHIRSLAATCAACHGTNGMAQPGMVSLAGQSKEALQQKMLYYKSGALPATLMHQLAKGYSDEQIEQLASYFAAQKK
jgi:cytochrome c553